MTTRLDTVYSRLYAYVYLRGFKLWVRYRLQTVLFVLNAILPVFTYELVSATLGGHAVGTVINYVPYFIIGLAFQGYLSSVVTVVSSLTRSEQLYGTIEFYFTSPLSIRTLGGLSTLWAFLLSTLSAVLVLVVGAMLGVDFSHANLVSAAVVITLLLISSLGIALLSSGLTIIFKEGNPVLLFFSAFTTLVTGTVFPISILPLPVRIVSYAIPLTWALDGLRLSIISGYSLMQLTGDILSLVVFCAVCIPLGFAVFGSAVNHARRRGTLGEY